MTGKKARQGSFGAPSINTKGDVAYACVLYGGDIGATSTYSIVYKLSNTKNARVALQGGTPASLYNESRALVDTFMPDPPPTNVYPVSGSGAMFRLARSVAINNRRRISFAGEMNFTMQTDNYQNGELVSSDTDRQRRAVVGETIPVGKNSSRNAPIFVYGSFFSSIFEKTMSINNKGVVSINATYPLTPDEAFPGFGYYSTNPEKNNKIVATTASPVIGLDFNTKFDNFSEAIVAEKNRCFVTADISDDSNDFDGIWQGNNPNLLPVVVEGRSAPGGGTYSGFAGIIGPSQNGKLLAYIGFLTGGNATQAVYRASVDGGDQTLIASEGDVAPGANGATFTEFEMAAVNNRGEVAVLGTIVEARTDRARQGIWVSNKDGKGLTLVALEGQNIALDRKGKPSTLRRIAFNPVSGINRKGQIAFTATFNDKESAVIIANYND